MMFEIDNTVKYCVVCLIAFILLISTTGILPWPVNFTRGIFSSLHSPVLPSLQYKTVFRITKVFFLNFFQKLLIFAFKIYLFANFQFTWHMSMSYLYPSISCPHPLLGSSASPRRGLRSPASPHQCWRLSVS